MTLPFPSTGKTKDEILALMRAVRDHDVQWQQGRAFSLVYHAGKDVDDLLKEASLLFFSENGSNPTAFSSLRKFETEIVAMAWFYPLTREKHARVLAMLGRKKERLRVREEESL